MSMSNDVELKVLELLVGKTAYSVTAPLYLALVTVAVNDTDTAASITEAGYTGYARISVAGSDWGSAAGSQIANVNALTFADCTGGSAIVVGWALCTTPSGAGTIQVSGATAAPMTVSIVQSPFTFDVGQLLIVAD